MRKGRKYGTERGGYKRGWRVKSPESNTKCLALIFFNIDPLISYCSCLHPIDPPSNPHNLYMTFSIGKKMYFYWKYNATRECFFLISFQYNLRRLHSLLPLFPSHFSYLYKRFTKFLLISGSVSQLTISRGPIYIFNLFIRNQMKYIFNKNKWKKVLVFL